MWPEEERRASSSSLGILSVSRQFYIFDHFNQSEKNYNCKNGYHLPIYGYLYFGGSPRHQPRVTSSPSEIVKKEFLVHLPVCGRYMYVLFQSH